MSKLVNGGWQTIIKYVAGVLAIIALVGAIVSGALTYAELDHKIDRVQYDLALTKQEMRKLATKQDALEKAMTRVERKLDIMLVQSGEDPKSID